MSNLLGAMLNARFPGVNMDEEGIHYGVIPMNELEPYLMWECLQDAIMCAEGEAFEANWLDGDCLFQAWFPEEYERWEEEEDEDEKENIMTSAQYKCQDMDTDYHPHVELEYEGVTMISSDELLFVKNSPHKGMYALCSPCMPNAGNLMEPDEDGVETHDVPKEWRRDNE